MASNIIDSAKFCLHAQVMLDKRLAALPSGRVEPTGMLDALKSAANKAGFEQVTMTASNSKRRPQADQTPPTVEVKIRKPSCETVATTAATLCGEGDPLPDPYVYLEPAVDKVVSLTRTIDKHDFDNLCADPQEYRAVFLEDAAQDLLKKANEVMVQEAYAALGDYADGVLSTTTPKVIPIISATGVFNSAAFARIASEFRRQGFRGRPIFVGGEKLALAQDVRIMGGTGTSLNLDPNAALASIIPYYDYDIDALVNTLQTETDNSYAMTWTPGSMQFLEWYRNTGIFQDFAPDRAETTLTIGGFTFDFFMHYEPCDKIWTYSLQKHYGLFPIPDEFFTCNVGNGRVLWELGCGDSDCDLFGNPSAS
jgi:hypothetical protein